MDCPVIEDIIHEEDRFAMMIDGANLYQAARALGFDIDYRLLLEAFPAVAAWSAPATTRRYWMTKSTPRSGHWSIGWITTATRS